MRRFLGLLRAIERFVHAIAIYSNTQQQSRKPEPPTEPIRVCAEIHVPENDANERRAHEQKAHRLRWATFWVTLLTLLALITYTCLTYRLWTEAKRTADTVSKQAEAADRPWVKVVDVKPRGLQFVGPRFQRKLGVDDLIVVHTTIVLKNIGRSVAVEIRTNSRLYTPQWKDGWGENIEPLQRNTCKTIDLRTPSNAILFPDDSQEIHVTDQSIVTSDTINREGPNLYMFVLIVGCIDYRFQSSETSHQTAFVYEVFRADDRSRFLALGSDVPGAGLLFTRNTSYDKAN